MEMVQMAYNQIRIVKSRFFSMVKRDILFYFFFSRQSKDLNALRCQEKQKQKLVDMIKCALNEVGCEELPSGCDDHLDPPFENGFNNDQQVSQIFGVLWVFERLF